MRQQGKLYILPSIKRCTHSRQLKISLLSFTPLMKHRRIIGTTNRVLALQFIFSICSVNCCVAPFSDNLHYKSSTCFVFVSKSLIVLFEGFSYFFVLLHFMSSRYVVILLLDFYTFQCTALMHIPLFFSTVPSVLGK